MSKLGRIHYKAGFCSIDLITAKHVFNPCTFCVIFTEVYNKSLEEHNEWCLIVSDEDLSFLVRYGLINL